MSTKSQTVFAVCFGLFLAVVVTVSLLFADKLTHAKKTVTHEFGHALGYVGHSPTSTDVMYASAHENYPLKTAEINHITQVYNLMN